MSKKTELPGLMSRALQHRAKATPHPTKQHIQMGDASIDTGLSGVEHNGLVIVFHDAVRLPPQPHLPPLSVKISEGGKVVFYGDVDPDNVTHCTVKKWERGDWEALLGQAH